MAEQALARSHAAGLRTSSTLIGRERPLAQLCERARQGGLAVVEGEAGVGKTRLVHEMRARLAGEARRVLVGHCPPHRDPLPLLPVVEALRDVRDELGALPLSPLAGVLRPLLPEYADLLPSAPEPSGDAATDRYRVFRALREVLAALGAVVVLEDVHWADHVTLDLLELLVSDLPAGLTLVVTYRADDVPLHSPLRGIVARCGRTGGTRVSLASLDAVGCAALVREILAAPTATDEFVAFVYERTEGLPFAVEEVLRLLVDRQDLVRAGTQWGRHELAEIAVPDTVRDAVAERVERLSPGARAVVAVVAVVGEPASRDLLEQLGAADVEDLCEIVGSGLVEEVDDGTVRFRHALARDAAYDVLPGPRRRELHRRVADVLVAGTGCPPGRVARHLRAAGAWGEWAAYAEHAADEAVRLHDERTARRVLADVLATVVLPAEDRIRLARKLGTWAPDGLAADVAADVLRDVLADGVPDAGVRGELRYLRGRAITYGSTTREEWADGFAEIRAAVPDLLDHRPDLAMSAMGSLSAPGAQDERVEEHLRWADRAVALGEQVVSPLRRLGVRNDQVALLTTIGDPRARALLDGLPRDVADVAERREEARGLVNVAEGALVAGHDGLAAELLARARRIAEDVLLVRLSEALTARWAWVDWFAGRWDELPDDEGFRLGFLRVVRDGARATDKGATDRATDAVRALFGQETTTTTICVLATAALAPVVVGNGGWARANGLAEEALGLARVKGIWTWAAAPTRIAVGAAVEAGEIGRATALTAELAAGVTGLDAPASAAALAWCEGAIADATGDSDRAADRFAAAVDLWCAMPRPYDAALAQERLGVVLLETEPDRAHALLVEALGALHALGAERPAARIRRTLRLRGVVLPQPWRTGRKALGTALSVREREVADLVAQGRTNRQIGEALALSPRTVEHHVERMMRKLGARSRAEIGAATEAG